MVLYHPPLKWWGELILFHLPIVIIYPQFSPMRHPIPKLNLIKSGRPLFCQRGEGNKITVTGSRFPITKSGNIEWGSNAIPMAHSVQKPTQKK